MVLGFDLESKETVDVSGPMDSPWPMKCHDNRHTGRSPYDTSNNSGIEKWRYKCGEISGWVENSAVIGGDGTIYFGDYDYYLYALNSNGTLKWKYKTGDIITSTPALSEDGVIYFGSWDNCLYALNFDGSFKWKFQVSIAGGDIHSSPAIATDGTIYFATMEPYNLVFAINPDGTERWRYMTNGAITSDPAIGDDGTIYIGSSDNYLYALYPNGTLRWRFKTGKSINGPASINEDGTIYVGSWDDYLYAIYPNGSMRWKCKIGAGTKSNPSIDIDGIIYVGGSNLYAIYPNGTIKWIFDLGLERWIGGSSPAISADGTIYFGTNLGEVAGGEIFAVNREGVEIWHKKIAEYWVDSSPCIGSDGTVYIGSTYDMGRGYIHAFGSVESNTPPGIPIITGTINGKAGKEYFYYVNSVDPDNNPVTFYIDWGDGNINEWNIEGASGETVWIKRAYNEQGTYTIRAKARDTLGEESDWGELTVSMPRYKAFNFNSLLEWFQMQHPRLFPLLRQILGL